jgi:hypothetical protein
MRRKNFELVAGIVFVLFYTSGFGAESINKEASHMENAIIFKLNKYQLPKEIVMIFPVPLEDTVGTNDLNNAITLMKMSENKIEIEDRFKDFVENVGGGKLSFLPVISDDTIGYAQSRRFILANLKENTVKQYLICKRLEENIGRVAIADAEKRIFLFEILSFNDDPTDMSGPDKILKVMNLSAKPERALAERMLGKEDRWTVHGGKVLIFHRDKVQALDLNLKPTSHPFVSLYEAEMKKFKSQLIIREIHLHPELPFAMVIGSGQKTLGVSYVVWAAIWKSDESPRLVPMIKENKSKNYHDFEFSPDGKWLLIREDFLDKKEFLVMPINPKANFFLEKPILLGIVDHLYSTAWISNPMSFVVLEGHAISRWNLTVNITK